MLEKMKFPEMKLLWKKPLQHFRQIETQGTQDKNSSKVVQDKCYFDVILVFVLMVTQSEEDKGS
jgi:hypothetical protein